MNLRSAIPADDLERLYQDEGLTIDELAIRFNCGATTIRRRMADLGIPARPNGPRVDRDQQHTWSPKLAYVVGLMVTDGNLSKDGRHLTITSKDYELLETVRDCLGIGVSITPSFNPRLVYRIQWSDRLFYDWLVAIGLMPAKSLRLGPLAIPNEYLADFVRGCIDGDGSIVTYTDRYNTFKSEKYVYQRLVVSLVSASRPFLEWLHVGISHAINIRGGIFERTPVKATHSPCWSLKYMKHASIRLLKWMYYSPDVPCLARKRDRAFPFLSEPDSA